MSGLKGLLAIPGLKGQRDRKATPVRLEQQGPLARKATPA
jgi:hypothetical protein